MEHLPSDIFSVVAEFVVMLQAIVAQRLSRNTSLPDNDVARSHDLHVDRARHFDSSLDAWPHSGAHDTRWPQPQLGRQELERATPAALTKEH